MADEPGAIMDENLLAAVVVLRFYEELDSRSNGYFAWWEFLTLWQTHSHSSLQPRQPFGAYNSF